jgi:hypothetical protein
VEAPGIENGGEPHFYEDSATYDACSIQASAEKLNDLDRCVQALDRELAPESDGLVAALQASLAVIEGARSGPVEGQVTPPAAQGQGVEQSLANAIQEAAKARRWDVVAELSRILEARTRPANVVPFRRGVKS